MKTEFQKQFSLLKEQQDHILSDLASEDNLAIIDGRLDNIEIMPKRHSAEIAKLQKPIGHDKVQ